ncbi:MAG: signal recognition particle-docking protein FtsY [Proteobacteria bacterium]|nr:signal recognition particle-docking protein FtsY [Pseudomonadota bacterium]
MKIFSGIKNNLSNTATKFNNGLKRIFQGKKLDAASIEEFEELLLEMDMGIDVTKEIISEISKSKLYDVDVTSEVKKIIADKISKILLPSAIPLNASTGKPHVIMLCGINGNGKTTTAGKLAMQFKGLDKKVMLAACDTFRLAATEQLSFWAKKAHCDITVGKDLQDPASVAYNAFSVAKEEFYDILIIDTAGRLHNQSNLMNELTKSAKVLKKIDPSAPHNVILVLDATTGQNALQQIEMFGKYVELSGLIITKLDVTSKGGIAVCIAKKRQMPIHAVGVGENVEDLKNLDPVAFAKNLLYL